MLHPSAVAWLQFASATGECNAFQVEDELGEFSPSGIFEPTSATLGGIPDYYEMLEKPYSTSLLIRRTDPNDAPTLSDPVKRRSFELELLKEGKCGHLPLPLVRRLSSSLTGIGAATRVDPSDAGAAPASSPRAPSRLAEKSAWISVIIPTRDNAGDAETMIRSLLDKASIPDRLDILLVDNGSTRARELEIIERLEASPSVRVLRIDEPFNWSRINNIAVRDARGDHLLFANDDMRMLSDAWDTEIVDRLAEPRIGVLGAKLLYPDDTLQHAGVITGWKHSVIHDGLYRPSNDLGPRSRWQVRRQTSAVTGAFLATSRKLFDALGGFDEERLAIAFGDIDFCFKARAHGYGILYSPSISLLHFESKSRGVDATDVNRQARYDAEYGVMRTRWPEALDSDPSVNPLWYDETLPFRLLRMPSTQRVIE
ncbi:MAG: glycosyltransferase, partial [Planctomycetota bacterium]